VERDYLRYLLSWRMAYFISTGYTDSSVKVNSLDPNKNFHISIRRMKDIITSATSSASLFSLDFIGMFVGLFPHSFGDLSLNSRTSGVCYLYVWDGSCEGGIFSRTSELSSNFQSKEYLKTSENVYHRVELSVKIVSQYNETLTELLAPAPSSSSSSSTTPVPLPLQMESILTALQQSLSRFVNEREPQPPAQSAGNSSRYLPGGFGILAIPLCCTSQIAVANSLQPGTWIRARKIVSGSVEEIPLLGREETIAARFTIGSSINVLPPFHWFALYLYLTLSLCSNLT
jgi:hypothetical protein